MCVTTSCLSIFSRCAVSTACSFLRGVTASWSPGLSWVPRCSARTRGFASPRSSATPLQVSLRCDRNLIPYFTSGRTRSSGSARMAASCGQSQQRQGTAERRRSRPVSVRPDSRVSTPHSSLGSWSTWRSRYVLRSYSRIAVARTDHGTACCVV